MHGIFQKQLFEGINVQELPSLAALLRDGEDINDLLRMAPTEILMRWVNHQLEKVHLNKTLVRNEGFNKLQLSNLLLMLSIAEVSGTSMRAGRDDSNGT